MFESLSDRFEGIFRKLKGRGRLGEREVEEVLREIRVALLEADVNFKVVKNLVGRIREECIGADLSGSLSPAQQVIKIVHQELIASLGGETLKITYASKPPTVVLLAGLQGSGKTTATGKLAKWFKQQGRNPLLIGADLQRPAAVEQLRVLGGQVGVPVFSQPTDPVAVAKAGLEEARRLGRDVMIVDTAGRLHIDEALMDEVRRISEAVQPELHVPGGRRHDRPGRGQRGRGLPRRPRDRRGHPVQARRRRPRWRGPVGQGGHRPARSPSRPPARSWATSSPSTPTAWRRGSWAWATSSPSSRRPSRPTTWPRRRAAAEKLTSGKFTLEDFLEQMQQLKKMGPLQSLVGMLPGIPKEIRNAEIDDREIARVEAIIRSMTPAERRDPSLMNGSRRLRVAQGSGMTTNDVNQLLKQFKEMQKMMRFLGKGGKGGKGRPRVPSFG